MVTKCEACEGTVSLKAITCPHCGHPGPKTIIEEFEKERHQKEKIKRMKETVVRTRSTCLNCGRTVINQTGKIESCLRCNNP